MMLKSKNALEAKLFKELPDNLMEHRKKINNYRRKLSDSGDDQIHSTIG